MMSMSPKTNGHLSFETRLYVHDHVSLHEGSVDNSGSRHHGYCTEENERKMQKALHLGQMPPAWLVEFSVPFRPLPPIAQPTLVSFFTLDTVVRVVIAPILGY